MNSDKMTSEYICGELLKAFPLKDLSKLIPFKKITHDKKKGTYINTYYKSPDKITPSKPTNHQIADNNTNSAHTHKEFTQMESAFSYFGEENNTASMYGNWRNKLTDALKQSVKCYTEMAFRNINKYLRNKKAGDKELEGRIDEIEKAINLFELKDDMVVHRRISNSLIDQFINAPDGIYQDNGFCSTTLVRGSFKKRITNEIDLRIKVPKGKGVGAWIAPISKYPKESEFLLQRGSRFRIHNITPKEGQGWDIELELIGRAAQPLGTIKKSLSARSTSESKFTWDLGDIVIYKSINEMKLADQASGTVFKRY